MQALDLHVIDKVRRQQDPFALLKQGGKLLFFDLLDVEEFPGRVVADPVFQEAQGHRVFDHVAAGQAVQPLRQLRVAQPQPPALGDAVGLVLDPVRIQAVPGVEQVVFQDLGMNGGHAVDGKGAVDGQVGHVGPLAVRQDTLRRLLKEGFAQLPAGESVDLPDDGGDFGRQGAQQGQVPLFEGLLHHGMVGVGEGLPGDGEGVLKAYAPVLQQTDQLRNGEGRVGVVQLNGILRRKGGIILPVALFIIPQHVLQGSARKDVLLL